MQTDLTHDDDDLVMLGPSPNSGGELPPLAAWTADPHVVASRLAAQQQPGYKADTIDVKPIFAT